MNPAEPETKIFMSMFLLCRLAQSTQFRKQSQERRGIGAPIDPLGFLVQGHSVSRYRPGQDALTGVDVDARVGDPADVP